MILYFILFFKIRFIGLLFGIYTSNQSELLPESSESEPDSLSDSPLSLEESIERGE